MIRLATQFRRKILNIPDREAVLRTIPPGAVGAEIGVWRGEFSRRIVDRTRPATLHLVDPWSFQPLLANTRYGGGEATGQADMDAIHDSVAEMFRGDPRVVIHRETSAAFWAKTPEASLDWVYIDGMHTYDAVLADLAGARRCVRPGGLILGDDYTLRRAGGRPVMQAVQEFLRRAKLRRAFRQIGGQFLIRV